MTPKHAPMPRVLLIGGVGYIGGHTALALHDAGIPIALLDNFSTSKPQHWDLLSQHLPGAALHTGDARDRQSVERAIRASDATCIIHFAALKSVPESVQAPIAYHQHNSQAILATLEAMDATGVRSMVFSSSAAVYGNAVPPIREAHHLDPANPYGATKACAERMLSDVCGSGGGWSITALRYFNPVGADTKGRYGEWNRKAGNVAPIIAESALHGNTFTITGADFDTPDGTGLRDYIHITDLAEAHKAAVLSQHSGFQAINIGTGKPTSVLELVKAFEDASGRPVQVAHKERRAGDVAACWADVSLALERLGWSAQRSVADMAQDHWKWITR